MTPRIKLKKVVEQIMEQDERTRNNDNWLIFKVLAKYTNIYIPYEAFEDKILPQIQSIIRARAKIQNEEKRFLPTEADEKQKRATNFQPEEGVTYESPGAFT